MDNKIHYYLSETKVYMDDKDKCLCACGVTDTGAENRRKMLCQNFLSSWFLFVSGWSVQTSNLSVVLCQEHTHHPAAAYIVVVPLCKFHPPRI